MTTVEVDQLPCIKGEQVWPIGPFICEPPLYTNIGPEDSPYTLVNWHASKNAPANRFPEDQTWRQLSPVGRVLGGAINYGHLEAHRDPDEQIDELNLIVSNFELYIAFHRFDKGGRPSRDFAIAGLREFITRKSMTQPSAKRAEPVVVGRDGQYARLNEVHSGWLFFPSEPNLG